MSLLKWWAGVQGWLCVARLLLPVAVADASSMEEAVRKVEALTDGLPLLHLAVRSKSAALVRRFPSTVPPMPLPTTFTSRAFIDRRLRCRHFWSRSRGTWVGLSGPGAGKSNHRNPS